jgi:hypothetical protein
LDGHEDLLVSRKTYQISLGFGMFLRPNQFTQVIPWGSRKAFMRVFVVGCLIFCLLAGGSVLATEKKSSPARKPQSSADVHIIPLDRDLPPDAFADAPSEAAVYEPSEGQGKMLSPTVQERILERAGLQGLVGDWDAFETDLFLVRVEAKSPEEVFAQYEQKVPLEKIRALKALIAMARKR